MPGLWNFNVSESTIYNSLFFRINDFVDSLGFTKEFEWLLKGTPRLDILKPGENTSGYVVLAKKIFYVIPIGIIGVGLYYKMYKKYLHVYSQEKQLIWINFLIIVLYPLSFPVWSANIYAFICGFSLFPLFAFLKPNILSDHYTSDVEPVLNARS